MFITVVLQGAGRKRLTEFIEVSKFDAGGNESVEIVIRGVSSHPEIGADDFRFVPTDIFSKILPLC